MDNNLLRKKNRRAVAPIIATLILVAIAVVGGVMIFVFAQDFFGGESMTGPGTIDSISMAGYDLSDVDGLGTIGDHTGQNAQQCGLLVGNCDDALGNLASTGDRASIFIKNAGNGVVTIRSIEVGGVLHSPAAAADPNLLAFGEMGVWIEQLDGTFARSTSNQINGQDSGTIYFSSGVDINNGRTAQVTVTTGTGQEFSFNIVAGQTS